MPKRVGNIYERMADPEFIRFCITIGTKDSRKKRKKDVRKVLSDVDGHVEIMRKIVVEGGFCPKKPHTRIIHDPSCDKDREINSVPFFPDGLMHIMEVQAMMDVLMRGMCHWSCASVPGRGGKRVHDRIESAMQNDPKGTKYGSELDIKGYYLHIYLWRLLLAFERKIKDQKFLLLMAITLTCSQIKLKDALAQGLTWRDIAGNKRGIFIGFYICQWTGNFFLEPLDHFIETLPGVKYFTRNMDNLTLLGPNKKQLHRAVEAISAFMQKMDLQMKGNWQVYRTTFTAKVQRSHAALPPEKQRLRKPRMVAAVGYRYSATHTAMRKRNFLRFTRQCRKAKKRLDAGKPISFKLASGLLSRCGQLKHCDSHSVRVKYVDPIGVKNLKEVVRNESKRRQRAQQRLHAGGTA